MLPPFYCYGETGDVMFRLHHLFPSRNLTSYTSVD